MATYCTVAQLLDRYRPTLVTQLAADDGAEASRVDLGDTTTDAGQIVAAAITDASGEIEAALLAGKRYSTTDLDTTLAGNSLSLLVKICAALTMVNLYDRAPFFDAAAREKQYEFARIYLDRLANGEDVFNLTAQKDAGVATTDGPTPVEWQNQRTIRSRSLRHYPDIDWPVGR